LVDEILHESKINKRVYACILMDIKKVKAKKKCSDPLIYWAFYSCRYLINKKNREKCETS
tara:strand:+ start:538 stop:717 length:180 start_codon:yes stop_codon:yes gene_type:complete